VARRLLTLMCIGLVAGCAAPTTEPPPPPPPTPPRAQLEVTPAQLALGDVPLLRGETGWAKGVVRARNAGEAGTVLELRVTGVDCVGEIIQGACVPDAQPWRVAANETVELPVALAVGRLGPAYRSLALDASDAGSATVLLSATGVDRADCLVPDEAVVEFPPFPLGCPVMQRTLRLVNQCLTARLLSDSEVQPVTEPFVVKPSPGLPRRLEPGAAVGLTVEFTGGPRGPHAAIVSVQTDRGPVEVVVRGERVVQTPPSDTFVQPPWSLDVLFVVDASPTFPAATRDVVAQRVGAAIWRATWFSGPVRAAVVGTGEYALRTRADGGAVFLSTEADFDADLSAALRAVPDAGSELETCLDTAARFTTGVDPFFRVGPAHAAWCLTNANEQSVDLVASRAALADAGVRWHVVGPPEPVPPSCVVEAAGDGVHEQLTQQLGGTFTSICDDAWQLPPPGAVSTPPRYRFPLSFSPVFPLRVQIDGAAAPTDGWLYETATNTVLFSTAPPEGSTITIASGLVCQ
jgi:hypothetical protein